MTIVASDTFGTVSGTIAGRTLDNGSGGSGSRTWDALSSILLGNGSGQVSNSAASEGAAVDMGSVDGKLRVRWKGDPNLTNILVFIGDTASGSTMPVNYVSALFACASGSLRIRENTGGGFGTGTDRATQSVTVPSVGTWYWLEIELSGTSVIVRHLSDALSVIGSTSFTLSGAKTGTRVGFGYNLGSNASDTLFDEVIMEDFGLGGGGSPWYHNAHQH